MLFLILRHSTKLISKNIGTLKINNFLPKLLESYGMYVATHNFLWHVYVAMFWQHGASM